MGRASNRKKRQQSRPDFPFKMLTMWIKHYESQGEQCKCGNEALYRIEHYMDIATLYSTPGQATLDQIWSKTITDQMAGRYTCYCSTYQCEQCMHLLLETTVGKNPALLVTMVATLAPHQSIIIGNSLQNPQDEGHPFTTLVPASISIVELGKLLKKEAPHINFKS